MAPAMFNSGGRKQENAIGARSFWLDIDVGEGKGYPSHGDARKALDSFIKETRLPFPVLIASGYGVQCFFLIEGLVSKKDWEATAGMLHRLCHNKSLKVDSSRTQDIASLMRLPFSQNWKDPASPRPAYVANGHQDPERVSFAEFSERVNAALGGVLDSATVPLPGISGVNDEFLPPKDFLPFSALTLADHCNQLKEFRDSKGNIPEPVWHAGLQVLRFAQDGEMLAHEWSSGHPKYSADEVTTRLERLAEMTGPAYCSTFERVNAKGCEGCRWKGKVKTPAHIKLQSAASNASNPDIQGDKEGSVEYHFINALAEMDLARRAGSLFRWSGKFWQEVDSSDIEARASRFLEKRFPKLLTAAKIHSCRDVLLVHSSPIPGREGEGETVVPLQNGYLHVGSSSKVELKAHDRELGLRYCLPVVYDPRAEAPEFSKFLSEALPDESIRLTVQEFAGYSLVRSTRFHKAMLWEGKGRNGKSTLVDIISKLHRERAEISLNNLRGFALEKAITASLLTCSEVAPKGFDQETFKALVAGDPLNIDRKHKTGVSVPLTGKLIMLANKLPIFTDRSLGFWDRVIIVPFEQSFLGREDREMGPRIVKNELSGVLNWAIEGLVRLLQNNAFTSGTALSEAHSEARLDSDPLRQWCMESQVEKTTGSGVIKKNIFAAYSTWARDNNFHEMNSATFWKRMKEFFPDLATLQYEHAGERCVRLRCS